MRKLRRVNVDYSDEHGDHHSAEVWLGMSRWMAFVFFVGWMLPAGAENLKDATHPKAKLTIIKGGKE